MRGFYRGFIEPEDLCFDVGANLGNRSRVFLDLGARVVALEPQPYCARVLRAKFGNDRRFTLIEKAVGAVAGTAQMACGDLHTIATLSQDWRERTLASGRWQTGQWADTIDVEVTTLDQIMADHGVPRFCKIDVEGFELEVLRGLSSPLPALSFEFTAPEETDKAVACLERIEQLGEHAYNYSMAETMTFAETEWLPRAGIRDVLTGIRGAGSWGDVYARRK
jgi:FkbM family methyltransferase